MSCVHSLTPIASMHGGRSVKGHTLLHVNEGEERPVESLIPPHLTAHNQASDVEEVTRDDSYSSEGLAGYKSHQAPAA